MDFEGARTLDSAFRTDAAARARTHTLAQILFPSGQRHINRSFALIAIAAAGVVLHPLAWLNLGRLSHFSIKSSMQIGSYGSYARSFAADIHRPSEISFCLSVPDVSD